MKDRNQERDMTALNVRDHWATWLIEEATRRDITTAEVVEELIEQEMRRRKTEQSQKQS